MGSAHDQFNETRAPARTLRCVADSRRRATGDDGAGLFGLATGVLVFLILLLFAMQVLLGLYARTVTAGAAFDAANYLARHPGGEKEALELVRSQINPASLQQGTGPVSVDGEFVTYQVQVNPPTSLTGDWWAGSNAITRQARVRVERPR